VVTVTAVLRRLKQVNALWHQANTAYFDPPAFRVALQNCITTARTVTFILQSHKAAIPGFEQWYKIYTDRFALDPVMRWAVNARNKIEKQGDLETLSQVRAELVAAYAYNPSTLWLPAINATPEQIRMSIPAKWLDEHVINTGVLAIERRWVDVELPNYEILDALAYVYGQLALLVVGLHDHLGWPIPPQHPDWGEHLIANLLPDGRLKSMERIAAHRTIYITVRDGRVIESVAIPATYDATLKKKVRKRYGKVSDWKEPNESKTFPEMAEVLFKKARWLMLRDGYHRPEALLFRDLMLLEVISLRPRNRREKYLIMREVAERVRATSANGVIFISEAWTALPSDDGMWQFAESADTRGEALVLWAATAGGFQTSLQANIVRKKVKKHKIKRLEPTERDTEGSIIAFAPILQVWGRLSDLKLDDSDFS
jgi:hypothetical protein